MLRTLEKGVKLRNLYISYYKINIPLLTILERQREGIAVAKAKGAYKGRIHPSHLLRRPHIIF